MMQGTEVRVVIPDDYNDVWDSSPEVARLRQRANVATHTEAPSSPAELVKRLAGAQVAVANRERTRYTADLLAQLPELRLIAQTSGAGPHLDMASLNERGIIVCTTTAVSGPSHSTVELTLGLMVAAVRAVPWHDRLMHEGRWQQRVGLELAGRTLGILGLGRIGSAVAQVARLLGMRVLAWGPTLNRGRAAQAGVEFRELEDLLPRVDVLTIHLRLSDISRGLLTRERLALMKPTAILINTARGPIVDEEALAEALAVGRLGGAALDVFGQEPLPADNPLRRLENVILTPHLGYVSDRSYERWIAATVDNILAWMEGTPTNVANLEALRGTSSRQEKW
ncbi:MAG: D-2-hydroxyacid dehydrogenase family protein [Chloroflexi bacterium]|nr:D-2-hydroxyacid dehydrogenase family protein [Chloroflexota bacterium]